MKCLVSTYSRSWSNETRKPITFLLSFLSRQFSESYLLYILWDCINPKAVMVRKKRVLPVLKIEPDHVVVNKCHNHYSNMVMYIVANCLQNTHSIKHLNNYILPWLTPQVNHHNLVIFPSFDHVCLYACTSRMALSLSMISGICFRLFIISSYISSQCSFHLPSFLSVSITHSHTLPPPPPCHCLSLQLSGSKYWLYDWILSNFVICID